MRTRINLYKSRTVVLALLVVLVIGGLLIAVVFVPSVRITKSPVDLRVEHRDRIKPSPHTHAEGLTDWMFHCQPSIEFTKVLTGNHARIRITKAALIIGLTIREQFATEGNAALLAHEQGHVKICERIYADADASARTACQSLLGAEFDGLGATPEQALSAAEELARRKLCGDYTQQTAAYAEEVSTTFDRITLHGTQHMTAEQAVETAFGQTRRPVSPR